MTQQPTSELTPEDDVEYDTTPQWSDNGEFWWDGQQWLTADEARAKADAIAAVSPDSRPAYLPAPTPRKKDRTTFVRRQLVMAGVVIAVVVSIVVAARVTRTVPPTEGPVGQSLSSLAGAEQKSLVSTKHYTGSLIALGRYGYRGKAGVTLTVLRADRRSYCVRAQKADVVLYVSSDADTGPGPVTPTPCV